MSNAILGHKTLKFIKGYYYAPRSGTTPELNVLLENIISGTDEPLDQNILNQIQSSNQNFTDINNQLEEIILSEYDPLENPENYLTFEAVSDTIKILFSNNCQYSLGTNEWFDLEPGGITLTVKKGQKIYFKATGLVPNSSSGIGSFTIVGEYNLSGNCNSMLFGDDAETNLSLSGKDYAFYNLFSGSIIDASQLILPATILAQSCYAYMFSGCTSLVSAPALPATSLADSCYERMFSSCTSLVSAPALPATSLAKNCYYMMFYDCSSLVTAPELPATELANSCYAYMFSGCKSLVTTPALPATELASYCYRSMFSACFSLTKAPALPATTLANSCYGSMFWNCSSLVTPPALPATTLAESCYSSMFQGCSLLASAPDLPATELANSCYHYMFYDCSRLVTAPVLPATELKPGCYDYMFNRCSKLNYIVAFFTTTPSTTYTYDWVVGVSSTGTFVKNANATWNVTGNNGIPTGWTVKNIIPSHSGGSDD